MFRKQKRLISLFLILCLCVSCFAGMTTTVFADDEETKTVTVTALPEFQVGASVADTKIVTEPVEGVDVKTVWTVYAPGMDPEDEYTAWFPLKGDYLTAHPTFQSDTVYELSLEFDQYVEVAFSDALKQWEGTELWSDGERYFVILGRYSDTTEITKVEINAPEPVVGKTATVENVAFYDAAGNVLPETAMTADVRWVGYTADRDKEIPMEDKAFEAEMSYDLTVNLTAAAGYTLPENVILTVNGEDQEQVADPKGFSTAVSYSLFSPLEFIEITGLPSFEAGSKVPAELKVVNGTGQYSLSVDWYVEGFEYEDQWDDVDVGSTFEAGKTYKAVMWFSSGFQSLADKFYFLIGNKEYTPTEFNPEYNQAVLEYTVEIPDDSAIAGEAEDDAEKAPATGDSNTILPFAVLIATGAAFIALRRTSMNK